MAVKIEKGGWALIFLVGLGLVGYSLKSTAYEFRKVLGSRCEINGQRQVDTRSRWPVHGRATSGDKVRVRVNIWVGCAAGLVANGGLDTAAGSIYDKRGSRSASKSSTTGPKAPRRWPPTTWTSC